MKLKKYSGVMLAWTAVLHTVVGIVVYWQQITEIANDGERAYSGQSSIA